MEEILTIDISKPDINENNRHIILLEKVDHRRLKYIIENFEKLDVGKGHNHQSHKRLDGSAYFKQLNDFYKRVKPSARQHSQGGIHSVKYVQLNNDGRQFAKDPYTNRTISSLQGVSKIVRHTVSSEYYYDIDIQNCHPTILKWYCDNNNIECEYLTKYISDREKYLKKMTDNTNLNRESAKELFIAILNGSIGDKFELKENCKVPKFLDKFKKEIKSIQKEVCEMPENFERKKQAIAKYKGKPYNNYLGSCLNRILCSIENKILMCMKDKFEFLGIKVGVLVFDGLMIEKTINKEELNNKLLEVEKDVEQRIGIKIKLSEKPMDKGLKIDNEQLEKTQEQKLEDIRAFKLEISDLEFARRCISDSKEEVKIIGEYKENYAFIWDHNTLLWEKRTKEQTRKRVLQSIINNGETGASSKRDSIFKECVADLQDIKFKEKINDVNTPWLPIRNGIAYNMETKESRKRNKTDYFFYELDVAIVPNVERAIKYMTEICTLSGQEINVKSNNYKRLNKICGYFWSHLNILKKCFVFIGETDTGKSTFLTMISKMMGQLHKVISDKAIMEAKYEAVHDDALITALTGSTLAVCSETEKQYFNEKIIKRTVGADSQQLRACGGRSITMDYVRTKIVVALNDMAKTKGKGNFIEKLEIVVFPNKFKLSKENTKYISDLLNDRSFLDELFTLQMQGCYQFYQDRTIDFDEKIKSTYYFDTCDEWDSDANDHAKTKEEIDSIDFRYSTEQAYTDYLNWCFHSNKLQAIDKPEFQKKMSKKYGKSNLTYKRLDGKKYQGMVYQGVRKHIDQESNLKTESKPTNELEIDNYSEAPNLDI